VAATVNLQRCWLIFQDHVIYLKKEEHILPLLRIFDPVPKPGPRKSQNVNKKKRTTAILTDTLSRML
jgi:hypothetical protein